MGLTALDCGDPSPKSHRKVAPVSGVDVLLKFTVKSPQPLVLSGVKLPITSAASEIVVTSLLSGQGAKPLIVQVKVNVLPGVNPVICVCGLFGETMVAVGPLVWVHIPVKGAGLLPCSVAVVAPHKFWPPPAIACIGGGFTVTMATVENCKLHLPFCTIARYWVVWVRFW